MSTKPDDLTTIEPLDPSARLQRPQTLCLTLLLHPEIFRVGQRTLVPHGGQEPMPLSRLEPLFANPDGSAPAPLGTVFLSRKPTYVTISAHGQVEIRPDPTGHLVQVDGSPVATPITLSAAALARGVVLTLAKRVVLLAHFVEPDDAAPPPRLGFVGESDAIQELRRAIMRVAALDAPVLIRGESGTGKELVAEAMHAESRRCTAPLLRVNLAAVPSTTAASELFGHGKGAFTGAVADHTGYFERAGGGSLFLDEVGSAGHELQAMLLRVLETGEIQPVGARGARRVDVRVLAATDENLEAAMQAGRFRAPLFHRLSGCTIHVPPLRDRRDDIARLLLHFLAGELKELDAGHLLAPAAGDNPPWLPVELMAALVRFDWPGNVRQLRNAARHLAVTYRQTPQIDVGRALEHICSAGAPVPATRLPQATVDVYGETPAEIATADGEAEPLPTSPLRRIAHGRVEVSDEALVEALRANRFSIASTAASLGISRNTLYALIERCPAVRKAKDVPDEEIRACHRDCNGDLDSMVDRLQVSERSLKLRLREMGLA